MKTIAFIRHAKSDWSHNLPDFDRPLNDRGKLNAPEMGARLARLDFRPDLVMLSPSVRTKQTYQLLAPPANWQEVPVQEAKWLYEAMLMDYVKAIEQIDEPISNVCFLGHNPTTSFMVGYYIGEKFRDMPTCAFAIVSFEVDSWKEVSGGLGKLTVFDFPKSE